jgi:carboxypeptidase Q
MKKSLTSLRLLWPLALALLGLPAVPGIRAQTPEEGVSKFEKQMTALEQAVSDLRRLFSPAATNRAPEAPWVTTVTLSDPPSTASGTNDPIAQIREEGLHHSQVMQTLSYLTDVIGPRLTGSPNLKRANQWARDTLSAWGLTNAHLEPWGPFGRGWSLKRFSIQVIDPQDIPLIGFPKAWSPGFKKPLTADVVYLDATNNAGLEDFKGKLKGAIVLAGAVREIKPRFEPLANRLTDSNLLNMANAGPPSRSPARRNAPTPAPRPTSPSRREGRNNPSSTNAVRAAAAPAQRPSTPGGRQPFFMRSLSFLAEEGAALIVSPSPMGDGGTYFVSAASVPAPESAGFSMSFTRPWATNAPTIPAQIALATEDYNRLVRMIQHGERLKMAVDLQVKFHNDDSMAYNTLAEIPGTDLSKEIVMLGGHIDSWHAGTGATDNGAGVAAAMEAVRIIQALKLKPRRTIRIGLWSGEEQGLLGSRAYVDEHFGYYTNTTGSSSNAPSSGSTRQLVRHREYERLSAYFNLDNGTGKIRGVYLQGNEALRPLFRRWLEPFADLEAATLTSSNTGGTDHLSFDAIGLPGFQFIQDPIDYSTRTHHSNQDNFDRIQADDMRQASVILAAFVYNAAMLDEKLTRKPTD